MNVLSVAYPLTQVSGDTAGGSEQILTILDRELIEAGHQSLVLAAEGSQVRGTLIPSPYVSGQLNDSVREWGRKEHKKLLREVLRDFDVDLIHMHSLDFHAYLPASDVPVLATLHLPPDWYPDSVFRSRRPNLFFNCVSDSERKTCPETSRLLGTVSNGIDVDRFDWRAPREDYVLALGRICPEKGFHFAFDAARQAEVEMILAGQVFPYELHRCYFKRELAPRLDARRRFIGPVGFSQKRKLLARAKCLLITSTVAETSSLVAMEAMACGTPVIAFPSGALPEIIASGRTGFLVKDVDAMARAIPQAAEIDPAVCRREAEERFSARLMTNNYLGLYQRMLSGATRLAENSADAA